MRPTEIVEQQIRFKTHPLVHHTEHPHRLSTLTDCDWVVGSGGDTESRRRTDLFTIATSNSRSKRVFRLNNHSELDYPTAVLHQLSRPPL